jgi:hypothetical protein
MPSASDDERNDAMRIRALLFTPVLVAMAVLGLGASAASAAKLYTNSAHSAFVPVGTTATGTSSGVALLSGSTVVNSCTSSSLTLSLTDNGSVSRTVSANIISPSTFSGCRLATTANVATPWRLSVTGAHTVVSGVDIFSSTAVRAVSVTFAGGTYTGDLTTGVTAQQPDAARAPLSLVLDRASRLSGPLTSNGQVTGTYTLTGTAAAYSLGDN